MTQTMKVRFLIAVFFFVLPGLSYLRADIYQWTDPQGVTRFGNQPPADAKNVRVFIKEGADPAGQAPGAAGQPAEPTDAEAVIQELEQEQQREEEERRRQREEIRRNRPPTPSEIIAREKERLEKKIEELEGKPLEDFGSQKNKRNQIGYYRYRLDTLMSSPEEYFSTPESYEGNVKATD
jgi:flagellar biosynthesis GTPase FlhF